MLATLKALPEQGVFMFGHHDAPMYGIGWNGDAQRSDVKSVCGDWPAVMSFDLGHLELGNDNNLDGVPFDRIRQESVAQYMRGGMVSFSWHADNPLTGKDAWDVSDSTVVRSVLPGGKNHDKFIVWLDRVADFFNSIKTQDGVKVPVLFRPWHEHTGSWFWWGQALCTDEEYDALWQMTYKRMREKGADQLLWAYSPGIEPKDSAEYMRRWPGDGIVDVIGVDAYQHEDRQAYIVVDKDADARHREIPHQLRPRVAQRAQQVRTFLRPIPRTRLRDRLQSVLQRQAHAVCRRHGERWKSEKVKR